MISFENIDYVKQYGNSDYFSISYKDGTRKNHKIQKEQTKIKLISIMDKINSDNYFKQQKEDKEPKKKDKKVVPDTISKIDQFGNFTIYRVTIGNKIETIKAYYDKVMHYREHFMSENKTITYINTIWSPIQGGKVKFRSVDLNYFVSYDDFFTYYQSLLKNIEDDPTAGSDKLGENDYILNLGVIDIITISEQIGKGGSFKTNYFNNNNYINLGEYEKNYCGLQCLNIAGIDIDKNIYDEKGLKCIVNMVEYLKDHKIDNIAIVANYIKVNKKVSAKELIKYTNSKFGLYKLNNNDSDYSKHYFYQPDIDSNIDYYIVYDMFDEHFEICYNIEIDDIYIDFSTGIYKNIDDKFNLINSTVKHSKNLISYEFNKDVKYEVLYVFFDFETVIDFEYKNINKPYSVNLFVCNDKDLDKLDMFEKNYANNNLNAEEYEKFLNDRNNKFLGYDCGKLMIEYIEKLQLEKVLYFISFNGCNFDNYILYNECLKYIPEKTGNPCFMKGQLLNFSIFKRHSMFDLRKHISGSLKNACKDFNIKLNAKRDGFDHHFMQAKYNNNELLDFIQNSKELHEYNKYDSISLALAFNRYRDSIKSIQGYENEDVIKHITLGSLVKSVLSKYWKDIKLDLPKFYTSKDNFISDSKNKIKELNEHNDKLYKFYKDLENNRIAGRVQCFNGTFLKIPGKMHSLDVCSLYPYVMCVLDVYYPCGEIIESDDYNKKPSNLIGFYYCDIDQTNIKVNIHALKEKNGNNWDAKIINNVLLSTPMIEYIKKIGGSVKTYNGYYFSDKIKSCKLFEPLLKVMSLKNRQDTLKENKDPEYSSLLRQTYKLVLNIPSGKLNQKLTMIDRIVCNPYEFTNIMKNKKTSKNKDVKNIKTIFIEGDKAHVTYEKDERECIKSASPLYIGTLIYDYAKMYMHEYQYNFFNYDELIYTDTDSNKLKPESFNRWKEWASKINVRHWPEVEQYDDRYINHKIYEDNSKVFGSFEDEYKNLNINISYFKDKKEYLCTHTSDLNTLKDPSFHFKGVGLNDIIINDDEELEQMTKLTDKDLNIIYNDKKYKRIKDDFTGFFEMLYTNENVKILTCIFKKINSTQKKQDETIDNIKDVDETKLDNRCYNIITQHLIKTISGKH